MTQNIEQLDPSLLSTPLDLKGAGKKSDEALAASLQKLEELFEMVATDDTSAKSPVSGSSAPSMENITNTIRATLLKNPEAFEDVIALIAPHTQVAGKKVSDQLNKVQEAFAQYQVVVKGISEKTLKADFDRVLAPAFKNEGESREALVGLYNDITPLLGKLNSKDPSKLQAFVNRLAPILGMVALRNPSKAKEILGNFSTKLESAYDLDDSSQAKFFSKIDSSMRKGTTDSEDPSTRRLLTNYSSAGTKNSPDMSGSLGLAMLFLQQFQVALSKAQGDQGTIESTISTALVKAAEDNQTTVAKEIAAAVKAAKAAAHRPWWEKFVEITVAVVGVVVAALTAGSGAAIVAVAVGAFMASPAFNDTVQAIASIMPGPIGQIIAKVIVTAIIMAASFGAGGVTVATDATVDTAVTEGTEEGVEVVAEEAAEEGAEEATTVAAKTAGKYGWSAAQGMKMAEFEGVSTLSSSGIAMDIMSTDSSFMKNHPALAMWLNIAATLVGMVASFLLGRVALSGVGSGSTLLEKLSSGFKIVIPLNWGAQMTQSGMEAGLGIQRAGWLADSAADTKKVGAAQAELGQLTSNLDMVSDTLNTANSSASDITKAITEEMSALGNASGAIWKTTAKLAAS